ncbi:MAG: choice-of-anchor D domain-containing protein [Solirubrobacteraceae bacterium]
MPRKPLVPWVCLALLGGAMQAPGAAAANVANPDPTLIERWEPCEPSTGVTVIVDDRTLGAGKVYVGCALGEQADGVEALQNAGFQLEGTSGYGLAFICRIDGEPTPAEQSCTTTPGSGAYWSYWRGKPGGRWEFSGIGAKSPQSRSPVGSVEGWSFGGGAPPRIEPMDGSGPSSFRLPPAQESSVIPVLLAREWLAPVLDETAAQAEELEAKKTSEHPDAEELLPGAIALARAGAPPARMQRIVEWLARSCEEKKHVTVEGCPLRELANPSAGHGQQNAERFALAVLGLRALGQSPSSFAGMNVLGTLEGMFKSTGKVESEGKATEAIEVLAPSLLALARTGALAEAALKTVDLILAQQNASTGSWETTTAVDVQAIEALVAAREQGAAVLEQSLLEEIEAALTRAGGYLEGIQEAEGGVREAESASPVYDPSVKSTALGAVGLALSGRQAAAERAAKWVTRYQVTAEYAGIGNPATGEHTPAEDVIGAFLPGEAALRNALAHGVGSNSHGLYFEARLPTTDALLALVTAGPYGPYDAAFAEQSLLFETRTVGSRSRPLAATLSNHDVRPIAIAAVGVAGAEAGDFSVAGGDCIGRTLAPGESCELSASFDPTATGLREALIQVSLEGSAQKLELPVTGTGVPESAPAEKTAGDDSGSQGVLDSQTASPARVTPRLDGLGTDRGLVGVSWQVLEPGVGPSSWTISSQTLGVTGAAYVARASGSASATSALVKLPAGAAYELQIAFTDALGRSSTATIGRVLVPYDDRWSGLQYHGRWQRVKQVGAWLDTVSRGSAGAQVSLRLAAGRPVFVLRATSAAAKVEVRAGSHRQAFAIAKGPAGALRQITALERSTAGPVSLQVLKGTVDLDGVAVEG